MADTITVEIRGTDELKAKLRRIADNLADDMRTILLAAAQPVVAEVVRRTPVRTGNLRRSYHAEIGRISRRGGSVLIGTDVEYAPFVEFGTSRMSARPHLRPGVEAGAQTFADEIARGARRAIKDAL